MWQQIIHHLNTSIILLNKTNKIYYLNPSCETLLATSHNQAKYQSLDFIFSNFQTLLPLIQKARENIGSSVREHELQLYSQHNHKNYIVDCTAILLMESKFKDYILLEFHPLEWHLRLHKEDYFLAQDKNNKLLLRNLAHEIKNPLGGLSGAAQLLEKILPDTELKAYTEIIKKESQRIARLVDNLLKPNQPSRKTVQNLHEIIERVRHLVIAEDTKNIEFYRDYDPSIPDLCLDADQIIQALLNIIRNAMQAINNLDGKIIIRTRIIRKIVIRKQKYKLAASIDIIDNGPGISYEIQEQIFQPLVTNREQGSGLGLSISQSLVQQHNGAIQVASQPGNTIFTILLPLGDKDI